VAFDRNKKEQEALSALGKGDLDKAANLYAALLRHDPRDRRIRQKLSDLYLRVGRTEEAERHLRELAKLYTADGNNRATIAVYKKLLPLAPTDYGLLASIGEAFLIAGFMNEAASHFQEAIKGLEHRDPAEAAAVCLRLITLKPADTPLRIKTAELLAAGGKKDESFEVYREIINELRRRGRVDEVGRLALAAHKKGKK
jgi:tetratricopeptide (TPR) repeat protein